MITKQRRRRRFARDFRTGEIAPLLGMSIAAVQRAIDSGELKAYYLPGGEKRRERRVKLPELRAFAQANGIPLNSPETDGLRRVLLVTNDETLPTLLTPQMPDDHWQMIIVDSAFNAAHEAAQRSPHAIVVDFQVGLHAARDLCERFGRSPLFGTIPRIALVAEGLTPQANGLRCRRVLEKPLDPASFVERLRALIDV